MNERSVWIPLSCMFQLFVSSFVSQALCHLFIPTIDEVNKAKHKILFLNLTISVTYAFNMNLHFVTIKPQEICISFYRFKSTCLDNKVILILA